MPCDGYLCRYSLSRWRWIWCTRDIALNFELNVIERCEVILLCVQLCSKLLKWSICWCGWICWAHFSIEMPNWTRRSFINDLCSNFINCINWIACARWNWNEDNVPSVVECRVSSADSLFACAFFYDYYYYSLNRLYLIVCWHIHSLASFTCRMSSQPLILDTLYCRYYSVIVNATFKRMYRLWAAQSVFSNNMSLNKRIKYGRANPNIIHLQQ